MARGDFLLFEEFANQLGSENHNLENGGDTIKLGIVDSTLTPLITASAVWATYSANEVATGGGYSAGGVTLENQSYDEVTGVATFDADDITITQNPSGFTDGDWGILYNDTNATDMAIGFLDLAGPVSEVAGPIVITWNASGIFTVTVSQP